MRVFTDCILVWVTTQNGIISVRVKFFDPRFRRLNYLVRENGFNCDNLEMYACSTNPRIESKRVSGTCAVRLLITILPVPSTSTTRATAVFRLPVPMRRAAANPPGSCCFTHDSKVRRSSISGLSTASAMAARTIGVATRLFPTATPGNALQRNATELEEANFLVSCCNESEANEVDRAWLAAAIAAIAQIRLRDCSLPCEIEMTFLEDTQCKEMAREANDELVRIRKKRGAHSSFSSTDSHPEAVCYPLLLIRRLFIIYCFSSRGCLVAPRFVVIAFCSLEVTHRMPNFNP